MINKLKHKVIGTNEKKQLANNIFSLGVLQFANLILPLLTLPYLVRVLGPEYFGLISFAQSTIAYFVLITDYGFNLSATRQISLYRDDKEKLNDIFSSVLVIKTVLMLISFGLMSFLVLSIEKFSEHWEVYFTTFGMVIGQIFFPIWLFQGMERMKYITYLNIGAKTFFAICIFIFVQEQSDYLLVPFLTTFGYMVAGIWSLFLVKNVFGVSFHWQDWRSIKYQLIDGWHVFFSSIAISVYTISLTFMLGLFSNNTTVGYFTAADKIVHAIKGLYAPISQAIYPLIGKKIDENKQTGLALVNKIAWFVGIAMFVVSLLLFLLAEMIVNLLLGSKYQESILLLQIMAFLPFFIALSNIYGIQTMLNLGYKQAFSRILVTAAALGFALSLVLMPVYNALGAAMTLLGVEVFVTIAMYIYLKKKLKIHS